MNKIIMVLIVTLVLFGINTPSFAMMCDMGSGSSNGEAHAESTEKGSKATDAGNRICPVTGEKIDESQKVAYEYKGKIYNFCCSMCIPKFKKDPEKYIKNITEKKL